MSTFAVLAKPIRAIEAHPNADAIELAQVDGYTAIVRKGVFAAGDLVAYIPEAALVPEPVLRHLGLWDDAKGVGRCAGKQGNRVKAIRLRGVLSQGLIWPLERRADGWHLVCGDVDQPVAEGDDLAPVMGIVKWEPPIPTHLAGEVANAGQHLTLAYDIENIKSYPDVIAEGTPVVMTEKIHGTFTAFAWVPERDAVENQRLLVFSKGLGAKGLVLRDNEANVGNLYRRMAVKHGMAEKLQFLAEYLGVTDEPLFVLGESFGPNVQDLSYGRELEFRVFDMAAGYRGAQRFFDAGHMALLARLVGLMPVPTVYAGPYTRQALDEHTRGHELVSGEGRHIREGVVVRPLTEARDPMLGRVILKSVSADYLLRGGEATEFN